MYVYYVGFVIFMPWIDVSFPSMVDAEQERGAPAGWAQAGPKWVGPSRAQVGAQVGGPKLGPSGWAQAGPKWVGPSQNFGNQTNPKNKKISKSESVLPKMSARSGSVGKKSPWPHLGPPGPIFCVGRKNQKNTIFLPIFLGGPMGPIHPVWQGTMSCKQKIVLLQE